MLLRNGPPPFPGRLLVVGGQCRKVGKSTLVVDLIRTFPDWRWTAVKITPYVEAGCPLFGAGCGCAPCEHTYAIREEANRSGFADTSRFLRAGAERAVWVQMKRGLLSEAIAQLGSSLEKAESVIIESDSIMRFWRPDLFLLVLDPRRADFKASARYAQERADGFVFRSPFPTRSEGRSSQVTGNRKPKFLHPMGYDLPSGMQRFVRHRLERRRHPMAVQTGSLFS